MNSFPKNFLIGAATAAHQVEGNNKNSDFWAMEHMQTTTYEEPSLDAVDHYKCYKEDIELMARAGLNAYRFSIEWARVEPEKGAYNKEEIEHYRKVLECCHENKVTPIVTMHHFSSPRWLITQGGWENESVIEDFAKYCTYVVQQLGNLMEYVCTINEANMGIQLAALIRDIMKQMNADIQVGINFEMPQDELRKKQAQENLEVFGTERPQTFLSMRSEEGDRIIMRAHEAARDSMKKVGQHLKIGVTLSLHDFQAKDGGEEKAQKEWDEEFAHYLPYIKKDDFFGLQNYTRKIVTVEGALPVPEGAKRTQMDYENYPKALGNVIRKVASELAIPIMITENGIATSDDDERITFIQEALEGVHKCMDEGIEVIGYLHWSLLDNFEWQKGYSKTFGLIAVDRKTQKREPKNSLSILGEYNGFNSLKEN